MSQPDAEPQDDPIQHADDPTNPRTAYKAWCFVLNNPVDGDDDLLRGLSPAIANYVLFGREHFAPG